MKRTLTTLLFVICCLSSVSAQSRYRGFVEAGASTIVGKYDGLTYQANTPAFRSKQGCLLFL